MRFFFVLCAIMALIHPGPVAGSVVAAKTCQSGQICRWLHTFVQHLSSPPCSSSSRPECWKKVGFEKRTPTGRQQYSGGLRDEDTQVDDPNCDVAVCALPLDNVKFDSYAASYKMVKSMAASDCGWNDAPYRLIAGLQKCPKIWKSKCPSFVLGNVCWSFTCSFYHRGNWFRSGQTPHDGDENVVINPDWTCPAENFASRDGCHCNCGAHDPDCDDTNQPVFGCPADNLCLPPGDVCRPRAEILAVRKTLLAANAEDLASVWSHDASIDPRLGNYSLQASNIVPSDWTCPREFYGSHDGCDCACGARDPDCDVAGMEVVGCALNRDRYECDGHMCVRTESMPTAEAAVKSKTSSDGEHLAAPTVFAFAVAAALGTGLTVVGVVIGWRRRSQPGAQSAAIEDYSALQEIR